jgi:hypothetical protein
MARDLTAIVPQGLDEADAIIFGRTPEDIVVWLFFPLFVIIMLSVFNLIGPFGLFAGVIWTLGLAIVLFRYAEPGTSVNEFLRARIHARRLPNHATSMPEREDSDSPTAHTLPDGGRFETLVEDLTNEPSNVKIWQEEQHTSEFTKVKNVYPQFDAIERDDGAFIGAVKITGTNLFLRSRAEENRLAAEFVDVLNTLTIPMQIFITTDPFDVGQHVDVYQQGASHESIQNNPILQELHQAYGDAVIGDERIQHTREREVYAVVKVTRDEIDDSAIMDEDEPSTGATGLLGRLKRLLGSHDPTFDESELRARKVAIDYLEDHRNSVTKRLSSIDGVSAEPISYEDHLGEIRGHWRGPMDTRSVSVPASPIVPPKGMLKEEEQTGLVA